MAIVRDLSIAFCLVLWPAFAFADAHSDQGCAQNSDAGATEVKDGKLRVCIRQQAGRKLLLYWSPYDTDCSSLAGFSLKPIGKRRHICTNDSGALYREGAPYFHCEAKRSHKWIPVHTQTGKDKNVEIAAYRCDTKFNKTDWFKADDLKYFCIKGRPVPNQHWTDRDATFSPPIAQYRGPDQQPECLAYVLDDVTVRQFTELYRALQNAMTNITFAGDSQLGKQLFVNAPFELAADWKDLQITSKDWRQSTEIKIRREQNYEVLRFLLNEELFTDSCLKQNSRPACYFTVYAKHQNYWLTKKATEDPVGKQNMREDLWDKHVRKHRMREEKPYIESLLPWIKRFCQKSSVEECWILATSTDVGHHPYLTSFLGGLCKRGHSTSCDFLRFRGVD